MRIRYTGSGTAEPMVENYWVTMLSIAVVSIDLYKLGLKEAQ